MSSQQQDQKPATDQNRKPAPQNQVRRDELSKDALDKATGGLVPAVAPQK